MSGRPVLGLFARGPAPQPFVRLAADLQRVAAVRAAEAGDPDIDAWLVLDPVAWADDGRPAARWDGDPTRPVSLPGGGVHGVIEGIDVRRHRPVVPFVRSRWRQRFALPPVFIVEASVGAVTSDQAADIPEWLRATALSLASAVVALDRPTALEAFALASPVVVSDHLGTALGPDGSEAVVIGERAEASELVADAGRAARLSRLGRRYVEQHCDSGRNIEVIGHALGLVPSGPPAVERARLVLDELWTPADSVMRDRVGAALAGLEQPR